MRSSCLSYCSISAPSFCILCILQVLPACQPSFLQHSSEDSRPSPKPSVALHAYSIQPTLPSVELTPALHGPGFWSQTTMPLHPRLCNTFSNSYLFLQFIVYVSSLSTLYCTYLCNDTYLIFLVLCNSFKSLSSNPFSPSPIPSSTSFLKFLQFTFLFVSTFY